MCIRDRCYSLRMVNFISLPAALGLMVIAAPAFSLFFQRGAFGAEDVSASARALVFLAMGLWAVSAARVLVPMFHGMQDTRTPVRVAFWTFALNLLLSVALMGPVDAGAGDNAFVRTVAALGRGVGVVSLSFAGLALANSLSATFQFAALMWLATRRLGGFAWSAYLSSLWRNLAAAAVMAGPLLLLARRMNWDTGALTAQAPGFVFLVAGGVVLYGVAARLLGSPDWPLMRNAVMRRLPARAKT